MELNQNRNSQRCVFYGSTADPVSKLENTELPELNDDEVLVTVRMATICFSDVHTITGARIEPTPSVLGHEACVEIVDHKRHNFNLNIGDRATFCIADNCGHCEFCKNGLSQKCVSLFKYGHANISSGTGFNGCYATHIVLRKGTYIKKIPNSISDSLASTINCALATMVNCVDQIPAHMKHNNRKAFIQGDGMLGLYGCALLKELGFGTVYCSGHRSNRSPLIEQFGAIPVYHDENLENETNKIDCIIEVCGSADAIPDGIRLLKPGGVYLFVGMVHPHSELKITGEQIIRKCLTIKGIHNYDRTHLDTAVDFLVQNVNKYPFHKLVSPYSHSLEDLSKAVDEAKSRKYQRICVKP